MAGTGSVHTWSSDTLVYFQEDRTEQYMKIHAPLEVLTRYAELLKIRMPIKEVICLLACATTTTTPPKLVQHGWVSQKIEWFKLLQKRFPFSLKCTKIIGSSRSSAPAREALIQRSPRPVMVMDWYRDLVTLSGFIQQSTSLDQNPGKCLVDS